MKTLTVKADDTASAMDEIVQQLGHDALIISTRKEKGKIIMQASESLANQKNSITKENSFNDIFKSKLVNSDFNKINKPENQNFKNNNDKTHPKKENNSKRDSVRMPFENNNLSLMSERINNLEDRLSCMVLVGPEGLNPELKASTYMQLQRSGFNINTIKRLRDSYSGLEYNHGVENFLKSLAEKLTLNHNFEIFNKKFIFIVGPSGSGKTTLSAKIAALLKEKYPHKSISVASLSKSNLEHNKMSAFARVLNIPSIFIENDIDENSFAKMKDFDTMVIDINLEPEEACEKIKTLNKIIGVNEKSIFMSIAGGSSSNLIKLYLDKFNTLNPYIALTKLDECDIKPEEISAFEEKNIKISILSGTKSVVGAIAFASTNIMLQYFNENYKMDSLELF